MRRGGRRGFIKLCAASDPHWLDVMSSNTIRAKKRTDEVIKNNLFSELFRCCEAATGTADGAINIQRRRGDPTLFSAANQQCNASILFNSVLIHTGENQLFEWSTAAQKESTTASIAHYVIMGQSNALIAIGCRAGRVIGNHTKRRQEFMPRKRKRRQGGMGVHGTERSKLSRPISAGRRNSREGSQDSYQADR